MKRAFLRVAGVATVAVAVVACTSVQTTGSGTVGIERTQYMSGLVSPAQVEQAAAQMYTQTLNEAKQQGQLNNDAATVQRVREIARRLIAHVGTFRPDAASWNWQVNVIDSDEVNAWCML